MNKSNEEFCRLANIRRAQWAQNDAKRDAGLTEPEGVRRCTDIPYTESADKAEERWHLTDIYYPEKQEQELFPVIVSVHGGGWFYGDKELYRPYAMYLATKGFAVVNFNYRRSPEYKYPSGFLDVCSLMDFIARNSEKYSLDENRLYMVGDSAGAQLASQYCIYASNPEYRSLFEGAETLKAPVPRKVALNCGIYDLSEVVEKEEEICAWYLPPVLSAHQEKSFLRIMEYMTPDFPQTYLMTSVNDPLLPQTAPMKQRLAQLKVPFIYKEFGADEPEDGHVFHLNLRSRNGIRCNEEETEFFKA